MSTAKKISKNKKYAIKALRQAFDRLAGEHSNIPECCIAGFIEGRTYMNVLNSLSTKKQKDKLNTWGYVPCENCFKKNKKNKIKLNGISVYGHIINSLIFSLQNEKYEG